MTIQDILDCNDSAELETQMISITDNFERMVKDLTSQELVHLLKLCAMSAAIVLAQYKIDQIKLSIK